MKSFSHHDEYGKRERNKRIYWRGKDNQGCGGRIGIMFTTEPK